MTPREPTWGELYFEETGQEPSEAVTGTGSIIFRYTTEFVRWLESRLAEREEWLQSKEETIALHLKQLSDAKAEVERLNAQFNVLDYYVLEGAVTLNDWSDERKQAIARIVEKLKREREK